MGRTELAINTDFKEANTQLECLKGDLARIAGAGFTHIHWCHEWDGDYIYSPYEMDQIREWMEIYGLKSKGVHATKGSARDINVREKHYRKDYTSDWEYNRRAGVDLIKNRVDLAAALGAAEIVLHLYVPHRTIRQQPEVKENFYTCVCRSMDELMPYCIHKGVKICLENLFNMPVEDMLEAWDRLFARYPAEFLGLCYDTGHANMIWQNRSPDVLRAYSSRLFAVHIHDNDAEDDFHQIPGEGSICWEPVIKLLARSAYQGPLLLELSYYGEDPEQFLEQAYAAGCRLDSLYRAEKENT